MRKVRVYFYLVMRLLYSSVLIGLIFSTISCSSNQNNLSKSVPLDTAQAEAIFDFAYPLVLMQLSADIMMNNPLRPHSLPNEFIMFKELAKPENKAVVLGNRNTLYCVGWINLSKGPVIFEIPDMEDRYYVMPLIDAWTNTFESFGSRTTGQKSQKYFLVNKEFKGQVPDGYTKVVCPTNMVWITGRIEVDSEEDLPNAQRLQNQYKLMTYEESTSGKNPFSDYKTQYSALRVRKPVPFSLQMSAKKFYNLYLKTKADNDYLDADTAMQKLLTSAGFNDNIEKFKDLPDGVQDILEVGLEQKQKEYLDDFYKGKKQKSDWIFNLEEISTWGIDYSKRAYWAVWGLGANLVEDAVYGVSQLDQDLKPLNGNSIYKIHFDKGKTPKVGGFWSITSYNIEGYLEENAENRYSSGMNMPLKYNEDGSLDMYLSQKCPEGVSEYNWVPTPKEDYKILFRMYWPDQEILNGTWKISGIEKVR